MTQKVNKYEELFKGEAKEIIQRMENVFIQLEKETENRNLIDEVFRLAHTLKGMSASLNKSKMEKVAHQLEDELDKIRKRKMEVKNVDLFLNEVDRLKNLIDEKPQKIFKFEIYLEPDTPLKSARAMVVLEEARSFGEPKEVEPDIKLLGEEDNFFTFLLKTDEEGIKIKEKLLSIPDVEHIFLQEVKEKEKVEEESEKIPEVRVKAEKLDRLMNYLGEIVIAKDRLTKLIEEKGDKELSDAGEDMVRLLSFLQDEVMNLRLIPAAHILDMFPRYVRDKARELGKDVEVVIQGREIELDRAVLEDIREPIVHLLRNAIDHGIEMPEERRKLKKPAQGKIEIKIERQRETIYITISDDGTGINKNRVIKRALELGIISEKDVESRLSRDVDVFDLLTHPDFSSKKGATELSGRGVGLDAVKKFVTRLGGSIEIYSEESKGTNCSLRLPLTLAIVKALVVQGAAQRFVIPLTFIQETQDIYPERIQKLLHRDFIILRNELLPVFFLKEKLGITNGKHSSNQKRVSLLLIQTQDKRFALIVDRILSQQDIFVKKMDELLMQIPFISGGTILGDGDPAFIIDPQVIIEE